MFHILMMVVASQVYTQQIAHVTSAFYCLNYLNRPG